MNKIICDICGTSYPDTAESCPVCGCSRDSAADFLNAEVLEEEAAVGAADMAADVEKEDIREAVAKICAYLTKHQVIQLKDI